MSDLIIERAQRYLRAQLEGRIRFDTDAMSIKLVVAPDGRLVASVMVAMLRALETVLEIPDDSETSLHLMVTMEQFDENSELGALADRWRIYHGDPPDVRWAVMSIDAARFEGHFIDGESLERPNPLAAVESSVLRRLNDGDRSLLKKACDEANLGAELQVAVGVDDRGIDVRRAFDVVRIPFPEALSETSLTRAVDAESMAKAVEQALAPS